MTVEDLEAQRQSRTVFTRNWVNTQKINYGATHGCLYVQGKLMLLREPPSKPGEHQDRQGVTASFLLHLERELLKVSGIRSIRWNLAGWQRTSSSWTYR